MKTFKSFSVIALVLFAMLISSCVENWNEHYKPKEEIILNENVAVINMKAIEYLQSETSFSSVLNILQETGLTGKIDSTAQLHTLLVVNNDINVPSNISNKEYFANTHVASVALSPSHLRDGMRVLMLNGKYLNITKSETPDSLTGGYNIAFNGIKATRITKVNDGYVYELERYIEAPQSLYEVIETLEEDYSIFRKMVLDKATLEFDEQASIKIGVDGTGNDVYDSIFTKTFPYFAAKGFDIMSEGIAATVLIPSNELVKAAIDTAKMYLEATGINRHDTIIENWVFQSAFFNKAYERTDFESTVDFNSVFGKQWRNTVQQVDLDSRMQMSNGVAYKTTYLKIPINVLVYRLKDHFKWYEFMTSEQKAEYFKETNIIFSRMNTEVPAWTGVPTMENVYPKIENRIVEYSLDTVGKATGEWELEFRAVRAVRNADSTYTILPSGIPPGIYDLCFGFKEYKGTAPSPGDWDVYFNDQFISTIPRSDLVTTKFHFDRNGQGYPEGYQELPTPPKSSAQGKPGNYDRDGTKVGVITITGTEPQPVKFTFHGKGTAPDAKLIFHHWCLRPTKDCY